MKKIISLATLVCLLVSLCGCGQNNDESTDRENKKTNSKISSSEDYDEETETTKAKAKKEETTTSKKKIEPTTEKPTERESYDKNSLYDFVDTAYIFSKYSSGVTVIHKVIAKKDCTLSGTSIAYDKDDNVVGKSTDEITLSEGKPNYFRYSFTNDEQIDHFMTSFTVESDSFLAGDRNAVEMEKSNLSGDALYLSLKQKGKIGSFAKYKLIFYKNNEIIAVRDGFFSMDAQNLNGIGSTDVAKVWSIPDEFDNFDYIYEP
jgi:hypothetical protein